MEKEYDENVLDYWKLPNENYILKFKEVDGLDGENNLKKTLPSNLGAFILSNSKRIMNNFIREISGFYINSIYSGDTDRLYTEKKCPDMLDNPKLVGTNLCQDKNDYETGGIFYNLFLHPKIKNVLTFNEFGIVQQQMTFQGFNDSKRLLDRSRNFKKLEGQKYISYVTKIVEKIL